MHYQKPTILQLQLERAYDGLSCMYPHRKFQITDLENIASLETSRYLPILLLQTSSDQVDPQRAPLQFW